MLPSGDAVRAPGGRLFYCTADRLALLKGSNMSSILAIRSRFVAVLAPLACLAMAAIARAEPPEPVLRTFGFMPLNFDTPDFLGDDSLAVAVLPDATDAGAELTFPLFVDPFFQQRTIWELHPAHHVVKGGKPIDGSFFWLIDNATPTPPPRGAFTFTGPDGFIESVEVVRIKLCAAGNCGGLNNNNGQWAIDNVNGTRLFVVVKAWFSK